MPHVAITMIPGRSHEVKKELAKKVQGFLAEELDVEEKYISVSIEDIPMETWEESMKKIPDGTMYVRQWRQ